MAWKRQRGEEQLSAAVGGRGQADSYRDRLHGEIRFLQKRLGRHDALLEQPSARADAELAGEPASECARRDLGLCGEVVDGEGFVQPFGGPVEDRARDRGWRSAGGMTMCRAMCAA